MTAPDRETLAAAIREALERYPFIRLSREDDGPGTYDALVYAAADALLAGPLAAPPGDRGSELPQDVRVAAQEAAYAAIEAADDTTSVRDLRLAANEAAATVAYSAGLAAGRADERAAASNCVDQPNDPTRGTS